MGQFKFASQVREQCSVVDHGLPEIFCACESLRMAYGNVVAGSILFDDQRMIDGNIRRTLLEVRDGIPASGHDGLNESVGFDQGAAGIVNKSRLDLLPGCQEVRAIGLSERPYLETLHPFFQLFQSRFRAGCAASFFNGSLIFGTEAGP